jgi:hypothetical protein
VIPAVGATGARDRSRVAALSAVLAVASLPALLAPHVMREAALAAPPDAVSPMAMETAGVVAAFVAAPLVALSACVLFLSPGLVLAHALARGRSVAAWLVSAFALSLVVVSLVGGVGQGIAGTAWRGPLFGWGVLTVTAASAALTARRASGSGRPWALDAPHARFTVASCVLAVLLLAVLLAPKLHWEALNGDGAHAHEASRLLLVRALPFFEQGSGALESFPGLTSAVFAFPASWFLRLFGDLDSASRLPFLLAVPLLFGAIVDAAEAGRTAATGRAEQGITWIALAAFALAMAFSATYNPYAADLALPGPQDMLFMVAMLAWVAAFVRGEGAWIAAFVALTWLSLPSGLMVIAFWLAAALLVMRPRPMRSVRWSVAALVGCVIAGALLTRLLHALGLPGPGREYALASLLRYFAVLQATEGQRFLWVAIGCGIAPLAALLAWRRQDPVARAITLVAVAYFLFFYVQANVALHHFVPVMTLAPVVWLRTLPSCPARRRWLGASAVAGLLAVALAWPPSLGARGEGRVVGGAVELRVPGYDRSAPGPFAAARLLRHLFPTDWEPSVPARFGGADPTWLRYARGATRPPGEGAYVLQPSAAPAPAGARLAADSAGWALWVRDERTLARHQAMQPPTPAGSRWLAVPRWTLFRAVPRPAHAPYALDVAEELARRGVNVDSLLARLGVRR